VNIAFISYEFPSEIIGGIGTYVRHAAEMMRNRGHAVTVLCATETLARIESWNGCTVIRIPCDSRHLFSRVVVPELVRLHKSSPFDVVEVPDLYAESEGLRERLPALPIVYRAHTPLYVPSCIDFEAFGAARYLSGIRRLLGLLTLRQSPSSVWRQALARCFWSRAYRPDDDRERRAALEADIIVPPSHRLASRLSKDWMLPQDRIRILPYPHIPAPRLLAIPSGATKKHVCFFGGVKYFKGLHTLGKAIPLVLQDHPEATFTLAGPAGSSPSPDCSLSAFRRDAILRWRPTLDCLRPLIAGHERSVLVRGFVPQEELDSLLAPASVTVFPSLFDNFPNACLEAMSAARAIVATKSGGMEEMLVDGDSGLLVDVNDHRSLASAISRLLARPSLVRSLGEAARLRVCAEYNPIRIGSLQEDLYKEAIAIRSSGRSRQTA